MNHRASLSFARPIAILILLCIGSGFAANHVAARIAFDNGTGLLTTIVFRAGISFLTLSVLLILQQQSLRLSTKILPWQVILGVLIALQSLCIFAAVARLPVAIALLVANVFPILLALLTWGLGGKQPTKQSMLIMGIILFGLIWVLDVPSWLVRDSVFSPDWFVGLAFAFGAACCFAIAMWITEHKLLSLAGPVRSLFTIGIVLICVLLLSSTSAIEGGIRLPATPKGWVAMTFVGVLYTCSFIGLFVLAPKLNMAANSPAMNIEPVTSILLGWIFLDQMLEPNQLLGASIVLAGIFALAYSNRRSAS